MDEISPDVLTHYENLKHDAACYGLPYGYFGIVCWASTLVSMILIYVNCPLFSPTKWCKPYKRQKPSRMAISAVMTVVPVIYTCIRCKGEWMSMFMAFGQLTPWSLKLINDCYVTKIGDETESKYRLIGFAMTIILYLAGWIGFEIALLKPSDRNNTLIISITVIVLILSLLCYTACWKCISNCLNNCCSFVLLYILMTTHIVASHLVLSIINKNMMGVPPDWYGQVSAVVFFIGKRLLFLDF
ncbi:3855_t:CDS:2 [Funneliformis caledonium]|uniref:3855_t:CDS:1 n=1 Tax=Funneliformis caledonium TaxID=1117310 RepID=A0A9N9EES1_9GLOM|nr:3855_t:CDS:2 [Funneliformis caledonium]